jgi:hypothetical protein
MRKYLAYHAGTGEENLFSPKNILVDVWRGLKVIHMCKVIDLWVIEDKQS